MKTGVSVFPALVLLVMTSSLARADAAAGQAVFESNGCQSCHYTQGPATEKTIADQLAKKGPELWYAGSKFQRPWLETWLVDPQPIRPMKFNSVMEPNP
ncbi:MAG: c-type cytochrome, partial [Proteobacteria bacterium]|nr:c-type cytochrome [Pseudomonadota bacterium]